MMRRCWQARCRWPWAGYRPGPQPGRHRAAERPLGAADGPRTVPAALTIIQQNLWWSFVPNFTAVPLAVSGLVTPWMAGIGMSASSLFVVLNALRLQRRAKR